MRGIGRWLTQTRIPTYEGEPPRTFPAWTPLSGFRGPSIVPVRVARLVLGLLEVRRPTEALFRELEQRG